MTALPLHKSIFRVALATGALLMLPLIAMQFTAEVSWAPGDFVAAAALLLSAGTSMVLAIRHVKRPVPRAVSVAAIALLFAVVWAELAVGLFW